MRQFPPLRVGNALRFLDSYVMMEKYAGLYLLLLLAWDGTRLMGYRPLDFLDGVLAFIAYIVVLPAFVLSWLVFLPLSGLSRYWRRRGWIEVSQIASFLRPVVSSSVIAIGALILGWRW